MTLAEAEQAVIRACLAERAARDAVPPFKGGLGDFPPPEFWEATRNLEAAHDAYETSLDTLLALRLADAGRESRATIDSVNG